VRRIDFYLLYVLALHALVACGDDSMMMNNTDPDAAVGPDGISCTKPAVDAPWLTTFLNTAMVNIPAPRATTTQRNAARTFLQNQLTQIGWTPMQHSYNSGANVYATIPATNPSTETRALIVGAHFDTVMNSPGANDNASGVAAVLAVARYLKDLPCRSHPVTIILFDEEELGLLGARAYANSLMAANVLAVHTVDQIAWDSDGDHRFELEAPTPALEADYRAAAMVVGVPVSTTTTEGTDHEAFRDRGFPAIGLTEEYVNGDTSPHRHTAQDTNATVDADYLELGTKLVAQVIIEAL
jgi:Zn-dependent M28 family amino/carboxypeptidase